LLGIQSAEASQVNGTPKAVTKTEEPTTLNGKPNLAVIIDAGEDEDEPKDIKTISRIASEYTQVIYLVEKARAEGCEYVISEEGAVESVRPLIPLAIDACAISDESLQTQRIDVIRQALFRNLEQILASAVGKQRSRSRTDEEARRRILSHCLEVYNTIQGWRQAEEVVKGIVENDIKHVSTSPGRR
jgi:hypothetical protein